METGKQLSEVCENAGAPISVQEEGTPRLKNTGSHTRREWVVLGERVLSHPRYALLIVAALTLVTFDKHTVVLASMGVFFSLDLAVRIWLQHARGFSDRQETVFLLLDALATGSLLMSLMLPVNMLSGGMYLRLARLLRGMYMLRMLRVFRFLTYETFIYSMPFSMLILALAAMAVLMPGSAVFIGIMLMLESMCRAVAVNRTIEAGWRYRAEMTFVGFDFLLCVSLLNIVPGLDPIWVLLRALRFFVMLNPLANLLRAIVAVVSLDEVRKESAMLAGMFALLMFLTSMAVLYLYPQMDLSDNDVLDRADYSPWQVVLYSFRILLDPGAAPADAFTPWLALISMLIVLAGIFFFALFVGLGSNVMHYLLQQLANSPLSARESILVAGWNHQALPVLKMFDRMCMRLRRSFASVWLFHGEVPVGARSVGRWLAVRHVGVGARHVMQSFRLTGVRSLFLFHPPASSGGGGDFVDLHAIAREAQAGHDGRSLVIADATLPGSVRDVYDASLGIKVLDSASLKARMLYQMHHCAYMPELGARMLNAINGEAGLHALQWTMSLRVASGCVFVSPDGVEVSLESWLTCCFEQGLNLLAARDRQGRFVLFSDLCRDVDEDFDMTHVLGLGEEPSLWPEIMKRAAARSPVTQTDSPVRAFTWPETWDLRLIFIGWHEGLPAMVEEMALKHHKLSVHVLTPCEGMVLEQRVGRMQQVLAHAGENSDCEVDVQVHAWDGLDMQVLMPMLKGCKVIMLYPENGDGNEDSCLELWFHEVARLLDERKAKVKWWTPPKLMVLPRAAENIEILSRAARGYTHITVDIGSPDTFHDVFMARQLLSRARFHTHPEQMELDGVVYDFMHVVLSDAVIIEDVDMERMLADHNAGWSEIYQESLRRGWILTAYMLPDRGEAAGVFELLERCFPANTADAESCIHLLAGAQALDGELPRQSVKWLFCRRGVLAEAKRELPEQADKPPLVEQADVLSSDDEKEKAKVATTSADIESVGHVTLSQVDRAAEANMAVKPDIRVPAEVAKEGVVMEGRVWPEVADHRLLSVLRKQISGALELLNTSTEEGLVKLSQAMDRDASGELTEDIMGALTDLQNIDRVMQRLRNVESCLADWASSCADQQSYESLWKDEVEKRYVMEEEREVLRSEL